MWKLRPKRREKEKPEEETAEYAQPETDGGSAEEETEAAEAGEVTTETFCQQSELPPDVRVSAASLLGSRRNQQDSLYYRGYGAQGVLACVCDGMGGLSSGEIASQTACDGLFHCFEKAQPADPAAFFAETAAVLDLQVAALTDREGKPLGAGTTITAALIRGSALYWLSVGDSKLFLIRGRTARCLTRPHNYALLLEQRLQKGQISQEEYEQELPRGEALVSYLGMGGLKYIDAAPEAYPLEPGDLLLLCSDGFYRQCDPEELAGFLSELDDELEEAAQQLARQVMLRGLRHMDNTSLILLRYQPEAGQGEENKDKSKGEE